MKTVNRRFFMAALAAAGLGTRSWAARLAAPRVAAIVTEYRHRSHADVIISRMLDGYHANNILHQPRTSIVSMYTDQVPENDMSRDISRRYRIPIYPTVAEALTRGQSRLDVDAVLLIGEHGNYPTNEKGQKLYPRFELFQQIMEVFRSSGRGVPLFNDKHLSYSWDKAKTMYDQTRELGFTFMAGSSIPVTVRFPELEIPLGSTLPRAVAVGYGGVESYGFHTLEALQCMVERRRGGEMGVSSVEALQGEAVWRWRDGSQGNWSIPLLEAALSRGENIEPGRMEDNAKSPVLFLLRYRDGLQAAVYMLNGHSRGWMFAGQVGQQNEIVSTRFGSRELRDLPHFDGLVYCIEEFFATGAPVYPAERTLLVSGVLDFLMESLYRKQPLDTPQLGISYHPPRHTFFQRA